MPDYTVDQEEQPDGYIAKKYRFYLLYNWKSGDVKMYTTENGADRNEGPYDIKEEVTRTIMQPKKQGFKSQGELEMDQGKIAEITAEEL